MNKLFAIVLLAIGAPAWATQYTTSYQSVPPSQDFTVLGNVGAAGDILDKLVVNVTTAATGTVSISDGATTIPSQVIVPANTTIGVYSIAIGARSNRGGWKVRTGNGASVFAVGAFH